MVFAICISMAACNGVELSVAGMVAVASVLPVVVAVMGSTVNMAAAMATATTSLGSNHLHHRVTVSDTNAVGTARCRKVGQAATATVQRSNVHGQ